MGADVGYERVNDVLVEREAETPGRELLNRFQEQAAENHPRLRGRDGGTIDTMAGDYPTRRQTWYLANEFAIHADDAGVPIGADEHRDRLRWRAAFAVEAFGEVRPAVDVVVGDQQYAVTFPDGKRIVLDEEAFVEAASGRPTPLVPDSLRSELTVLA